MESLLQKVYDFPCHKSAIIKVYFLPHFKITKNNLSNNNNNNKKNSNVSNLTIDPAILKTTRNPT